MEAKQEKQWRKHLRSQSWQPVLKSPHLSHLHTNGWPAHSKDTVAELSLWTLVQMANILWLHQMVRTYFQLISQLLCTEVYISKVFKWASEQEHMCVYGQCVCVHACGYPCITVFIVNQEDWSLECLTLKKKDLIIIMCLGWQLLSIFMCISDRVMMLWSTKEFSQKEHK